jgi:hypothetical protein
VEVEVDVEVEVEVVAEVANEYIGGGTELVAVLDVAACVVVCACVLDETVTTSTPGHREAMPMPNWKTPMILVSPTSTPLHTLWISAPISTSPCTHAALQRVGGEKSLGWQPLMVVVYAARHCALSMLSTRGVKLERETVAEVPVMRSAKLSATERSVICIATSWCCDALWARYVCTACSSWSCE